MQCLIKSLLLLICVIGSLLIKQEVSAQTCPMPDEIAVEVNKRLNVCYYVVPATSWRSCSHEMRCFKYYNYTPDDFKERLKNLKFYNVSIESNKVLCYYMDAQGHKIMLKHSGKVTQVHWHVLRQGPPVDISDCTFFIES